MMKAGPKEAKLRAARETRAVEDHGHAIDASILGPNLLAARVAPKKTAYRLASGKRGQRKRSDRGVT